MNFIKIAINLVILLCTFNYAYSVELVELNQRNLITLRGPIKHESVSDFLNKTSRVDSNEIYIYISSPGGSVMEGMKIVDLIKALEKSGKKVSCISDFSASMAFIILQSCPNRLATFSSVLMQHQMSLGLEGNLENVRSYLQFIGNVDEELNRMQAEKIGMNERDFKNKVMSDWWIHGPDAKKNGVVDEIVTVKCHQELSGGKEIITVTTMFGPINLVYDKCPLSRYPIKVEYDGQFPIEEVSKVELEQWFNYKQPIFRLNY